MVGAVVDGAAEGEVVDVGWLTDWLAWFCFTLDGSCPEDEAEALADAVVGVELTVGAVVVGAASSTPDSTIFTTGFASGVSGEPLMTSATPSAENSATEPGVAPSPSGMMPLCVPTPTTVAKAGEPFADDSVSRIEELRASAAPPVARTPTIEREVARPGFMEDTVENRFQGNGEEKSKKRPRFSNPRGRAVLRRQ